MCRISRLLPPSERATSTKKLSASLAPASTVSSCGNTADTNTKTTSVRLPTPNQAMNNGSQAMLGIDQNTKIYGSNSFAAGAKMPSTRPSDVPTMNATESPIANGHSVCKVARTSSPEAVSWTKATATLAGDGRITGGTFMLTICQSTMNATAEQATRT